MNRSRIGLATLAIAFLLGSCPASMAASISANLEACSRFRGVEWQTECYAIVAGHADKPENRLYVIPPPPIVEPPPPTLAQLCRANYAFAATIMAARQSGRSMPDMIDEAEGDPDFTAIVRDAYRVPINLLEAGQAVAIEQFANQYYNSCLSQ